MIKLNIKINVDAQAIASKVDQAIGQAQFALDTQVLKDSNYFIPKDTGELERSSLRHSLVGEGHIEWNTPYARRLYYNPQYDFSKDVNPNARGLWFEEAKALHLQEWVNITQQTFDKHMK